MFLMSLILRIFLVPAAIVVLIMPDEFFPEFLKEKPNRKITVARSGAFLFLWFLAFSL